MNNLPVATMLGKTGKIPKYRIMPRYRRTQNTNIIAWTQSQVDELFDPRLIDTTGMGGLSAPNASEEFHRGLSLSRWRTKGSLGA